LSGDKDTFGSGAFYPYDKKGMVKFLPVAELNKVAFPYMRNVAFYSERTYTLVVYEKAVKKFHARPGRGLVVAVYVVPTENGRIIHRFASRKKALGREVCAVAAQAVEI
jgi:hypothetical protein